MAALDLDLDLDPNAALDLCHDLHNLVLVDTTMMMTTTVKGRISLILQHIVGLPSIPTMST